MAVVVNKVAIPAEAGICLSCDEAAEPWTPACPTDLVRGLKAHGAAQWCENRE